MSVNVEVQPKVVVVFCLEILNTNVLGLLQVGQKLPIDDMQLVLRIRFLLDFINRLTNLHRALHVDLETYFVEVVYHIFSPVLFYCVVRPQNSFVLAGLV